MKFKAEIDQIRTLKKGMKLTLAVDDKQTIELMKHIYNFVDVIGMGRDRETYDDSNHRKMCLCRKHHSEAHQIGMDAFQGKYHVYGIIWEG